jgi:hypothetical protein
MFGEHPIERQLPEREVRQHKFRFGGVSVAADHIDVRTGRCDAFLECDIPNEKICQMKLRFNPEDGPD